MAIFLQRDKVLNRSVNQLKQEYKLNFGGRIYGLIDALKASKHNVLSDNSLDNLSNKLYAVQRWSKDEIKYQVYYVEGTFILVY